MQLDILIENLWKKFDIRVGMNKENVCWIYFFWELHAFMLLAA